MENKFEPLPFKLSEKLKPDACDFLYELYLRLREAPSSLSRVGRYRTFESAAVDLCKWNIDAISIKALEHIVTERTSKGLRRGHRMARKDRGTALFDSNTPAMAKDDMLNFFFENDRVTWVTELENRSNGVCHWSPQIAVPDGYFQGGSWSVPLNKRDLSWAETALQEYRAKRHVSAGTES